jgi:hypothetical protein
MKILAILVNAFWLIFISVNLVKDGFQSRLATEPGETFLILLFSVTLINLLYIFFSSGESWPALYFKRKALEEKKRIAELSKEKTEEIRPAQ